VSVFLFNCQNAFLIENVIYCCYFFDQNESKKYNTISLLKFIKYIKDNIENKNIKKITCKSNIIKNLDEAYQKIVNSQLSKYIFELRDKLFAHREFLGTCAVSPKYVSDMINLIKIIMEILYQLFDEKYADPIINKSLDFII